MAEKYKMIEALSKGGLKTKASDPSKLPSSQKEVFKSIRSAFGGDAGSDETQRALKIKEKLRSEDSQARAEQIRRDEERNSAEENAARGSESKNTPPPKDTSSQAEDDQRRLNEIRIRKAVAESRAKAK